MAKLSARLYVRVHDPEPHSGTDERLNPFVRLTMGIGRRLSTHLLANGEYCAAKLRDRYRRDVIATQHGEILIPTNSQLSSPEARTFLFFGRIEKYKGLEVALDAIDILERANIPCRLIVAGRGSELTRLGPRLQTHPFVKLIPGYLSYTELVSLIQKTSCVLMPYLDATQSGVLAAAFAGGRPVIASDVGGISELVRHNENGLLVAPNDAKALAEQMKLFLSSQAISEKLAVGARKAAANELSWKTITAKISRLYL
ncbi:hypothetical protein ASG42_28170 [Rhizobium sp. Leaf391]|nr:hypothetical protein ASG42_28170 [Rhizobium sp. Leaf391]